MNVRRYRGYFALAILALLSLAFLLPGCGGDGTPVVLAASNDLEDSGILEAWSEGFQSSSGERLELLVVPDRQALEMARHGECDVVLTHYYEEEARLERLGYVEGMAEIMSEDYVLVGPPQDPAGVNEAENITDALKRIAETGQTFILRIDGSGTAIRSSALWSASGASVVGEWILPTEAGAEEVLRETSLEGAYTLSGRSVYERLESEVDLEVLFEDEEALADLYRTAAVSTVVFPDTNLDGAREFIAYLLSPEAREFLRLGVWELPAE